MSEHIQPLLDRIRTEGLKKAEDEREVLLERARAEADTIRAEAAELAKSLREKAEADAAATLARGTAALQQAARDGLLQFRAELLRQVESAAQTAAAAALSADSLVTDLIRELLKTRNTSGKVTVEAGSELAKKLDSLLPALLKELGNGTGADIRMNPRSGAGFKLKFDRDAAVTDLSDEAIADWLAAYLRPELAKLLLSSRES